MLRAAVLLLAVLVAPSFAAAQSRADVDAPSQAVSTDGRVAHAWLSLRTDVVSPFLGAWGGTLDVAPLPWLSIGVTPTYVSRGSGTGLAADATLRVWPLGRGLDGLFVGGVVSVLRTSLDDVATTALGAGADAGWQLVWSGLTLTVSGGAEWMGAVDGPSQGIEGWSARVRVEVGATFR